MEARTDDAFCARVAEFGFRCILWVFSGRRGMHCWVADPEARRLSNEVRQVVTDYMAVLEQKVLALCLLTARR